MLCTNRPKLPKYPHWRLTGGSALAQIHGGFGGGRDGSESGREIWEMIVLLFNLGGTFVEVQGVTEGIVLELPGGDVVAVAVVVVVVVVVAIEAADEGLPLGSGDDLGPLSNLLECPNGLGPPAIGRVGGAETVPEGGVGGGGEGEASSGGRRGGAEAGEVEVEAAAVAVVVVGVIGGGGV